MVTNLEPLTALGDPTRRAIFERLAGGPMAVGAIARDLPISRPAVSQHLRVLKHAGLVIDRADANRRIYSIEHRKLDRHGDGWESMREGVGSDDGWQKGLDAFARVVAA